MRAFTGSRNSIRQQDVKLTGSPDVFTVLDAAAGSVENFSGPGMKNLMKNLTRMKN